MAGHELHRQLEADLLRDPVRGLLRDPARVLSPYAQPDRAQADEVAGVGHGRGRDAVLPLLRDPVRAGPRAAPGHGARGLHPARPHPALPGLRGGQAPPDGRRADLPADARLHPGPGRDPGHVPARGEPVPGPDRLRAGAPRHRHRDPVHAGRGLAVQPGQEPHPGRHRPPLLPRALQLAARAAAPVPGPQRGPGPGAHGGAAAPGRARRAGRELAGPVPAPRRRRLLDLQGPRLHARRLPGPPAARGLAGRARPRASPSWPKRTPSCTRRRGRWTFRTTSPAG